MNFKNRFSEKFDSRKSIESETKLHVCFELSWISFSSSSLEKGNLWHPGYQILSSRAKTPRILLKKVAHGLHFDTSEMEVKIPWSVLLSLSISSVSRSSLMPISAIKLQSFGIFLSLDVQSRSFQDFLINPSDLILDDSDHRRRGDTMRLKETRRCWTCAAFRREESGKSLISYNLLGEKRHRLPLELPFRHLTCFGLRLRLECRYGCKIDYDNASHNVAPRVFRGGLVFILTNNA